MNKKIYLSPHTLNVFRECPRCFYQEVKWKVKRPRGPFPSLPNGIDAVLKTYFNIYRQSGELPPFLRSEINGHLMKDLKETYWHQMDATTVLFGKLDDCIVLPDGRHAPFDHKTKATPPDDIHPAYVFQMATYRFLLEGNRYPVADHAYLVYYCPVSHRDDTVTDIKDVIRFQYKILRAEHLDGEQVRQVVHDAVSCLKEDDLPASGVSCEYCAWMKTIGGLTGAGTLPPIQSEQPGEKAAPPSDDAAFEKGNLF